MSSTKRETISLEPPPRMLRPIQRRPWVIGAPLVFAIALTISFGTKLAPHIAQPGDLSLAHAQILEGTLTQDRCTACHVNVSAQAWSQMRTTGHTGADIETATMTDRCLQCHHHRISSRQARSAHNLSVDDRLRLTQRLHRTNPERSRQRDELVTRVSNQAISLDWWTGLTMAGPSVTQDDVACSVCHREHHGVHANLAEVTDAQCQSCHTRQFNSFATDHPEFENYPSSSTLAITFDHVRHANLHFPQQAEMDANGSLSFDCRACHLDSPSLNQEQAIFAERSTANDPIVGTLPFETACASCHDEQLKVAISTGPALISLPTFPEEVTRQLESWPDGATGSPDGELSQWMKVLLTAQDPELDLEGMGNLDRVDWQSPARQNQAVALARAIRTFAIDLSVNGQPWLRDLAIRAGACESDAMLLARSFQPQLMRDAVRKWFGQSNSSVIDRFSTRPDAGSSSNGSRLIMTDDLLLDESSGGDDLLEDDLLGDDLLGDDLLEDWSPPPDPLAVDPLAPVAPLNDTPQDWLAEVARRFDPAKTQSFGGWYRDDLTLSLRYRGTGHADEVLRILIDLTRLRNSQPPQHTAMASCIECHHDGRWKAEGITGLRDRLTKFTHRPHLNIRGLQDCQHCHSLSSSPIDATLKNGHAWISQVSTHPNGAMSTDFTPLQKAACVACHTSAAAGDHCTTCHRYHVGDVP